jgi:hypothetical protein
LLGGSQRAVSDPGFLGPDGGLLDLEISDLLPVAVLRVTQKCEDQQGQGQASDDRPRLNALDQRAHGQTKQNNHGNGVDMAF